MEHNRIIYLKKARFTTVWQEEEADRISYLPEVLLLRILSFLKMNDVMKTSLVSKRWKYLWRYATCLDFVFYNWRCRNASNDASIRRIISDKFNFIDRSVISHEGSKINKFCIQNFLDKDCCSKDQVNSWIRFAVRRNVEELTLDFGSGCSSDYRRDPRYKLPNSVFNCTSLTTLSLSFCDLTLPASMHLPSLKKLALRLLYISTDVIKCLTSSCPQLEELVLDDCFSDDNLYLFIENHNLKSLEIKEYIPTSTKIMICAPHLVSLSFWYNLGKAKYCLEKLPSLLKANFYDLDYGQLVDDEHHGYEWARLLGDVLHVKELNLRSAFIGGLSAWALQKFDSLANNATCIQLDSDFTKWELPGISFLLRNSSKLEDLTIGPALGKTRFSSSFEDQYDFEERGFWESSEFDFSAAMQNLKTVKICLCSGTNVQGDADDVLCEFENKFEFVKFVLKNSKALEKMILTIGKNSNPSCKKYDLLFKFTEKLIVLLPRASSNAEIRII